VNEVKIAVWLFCFGGLVYSLVRLATESCRHCHMARMDGHTRDCPRYKSSKRFY
jgi:hypothetical protein